MRYSVSWDGPSPRGRKATVSTEAELDAVLEQVAVESAAKGIAFAVQINRAASPGAVMIGVGDPGRSLVDWLMDKGTGTTVMSPVSRPALTRWPTTCTATSTSIRPRNRR